jgi:DNA-binding Lrp family transcriptional regulator
VLEKNDAQILYALSHNPRGTILELARATGSAPATIKKRIVALQKNGAIISTSTYVDLWSCGCDLVSASFIVTGKENVDTLVRHLLSIPKTGNVWEFDHEWNINVVFWIKDQSEVSDIINQLKKSCRGILDVELMVLVRMVGK